jgi:hypothetical protein
MVLASIIGQHEDLRARIRCFLLSCLGNWPSLGVVLHATIDYEDADAHRVVVVTIGPRNRALDGPGCRTFLGVAQVLRSVSSVNLPGSSPSGCRRAISGTSGTCAAILGVRSIAWVGVATVTVPNAGAAKPRMLEVADAAITGVHGAVFSCIRGSWQRLLCDFVLEVPFCDSFERTVATSLFRVPKENRNFESNRHTTPTPQKGPGFRRARSFF